MICNSTFFYYVRKCQKCVVKDEEKVNFFENITLFVKENGNWFWLTVLLSFNINQYARLNLKDSFSNQSSVCKGLLPREYSLRKIPIQYGHFIKKKKSKETSFFLLECLTILFLSWFCLNQQYYPYFVHLSTGRTQKKKKKFSF